MGRGSAYSYQFFMLFDDNHDLFLYQEDNPDTEREFCEEYYNDFLDEVAHVFGTELDPRPKWISRESQIIAETSRLEIGIDCSGGYPCIFIVPKTYGRWYEKEYKVQREVSKAFNILIRIFNGTKGKLNANPLFYYPTTAWTSSPYVEGKFFANVRRVS